MRSMRATLAALAVGMVLTLAACEEEGPAERAGKKVDEAADKVGDAMEDAGDKVEDAVD